MLTELIASLPPSSAGIWVLVLITAVALVKAWPLLRKLQVEADSSLRADLMGMISALRSELVTERLHCEERLKTQAEIHRREIDEMKGEIKGLRDQLIQIQVTTGYPIALDKAPQTLKAIQSLKDNHGFEQSERPQ